EPVAGAAADHQRGPQTGARRALPGDRDLRVDVGGTTGGMGVEADESADAGGDDLAGHGAFLPAPGRKVKRDGPGGGPGDGPKFATSRSVDSLPIVDLTALKRILVPTDFSDPSAEALKTAMAFG